VQSAVHLEKQGIEIALVQGWVPRDTDSWLVKLATRIVGRESLIAGLQKRMPEEFSGKIKSCAFSEFFLQLCFLISKKLGWPSQSKSAFWGWVLFGWQSKKYVKDAEIFHVRSGAGQGGAIAKAKLKGTKVVVDHSAAHPSFMEKALRPEYEEAREHFAVGPNDRFWKLVLKDCEDANVLLVNSEFVKQTFVAEGYPAEKIAVAYLGIRSDFNRIKTSYGLCSPVQLAFTGNFGFLKGAKYLLQALQILDKKGIAYELTVAGTATEAMSLLKAFPIAGKIHLLGHIPQDDLKNVLAKADIYVFPSLCEGCASSVMEALAAGLPVVTTVESGAPIADNETGYIVPSKNALALAEKIEWIKNNPAEGERVGRAAAHLIRENYTWKHYAETVEEVYKKCLQML
jgi:glycosyltransferase involved in cell wall biosynthesis